MPTSTTTALEAPLDLVLLPVTFGLRSGTMRLADGRLTYTRRRRREVLFDAPLDEFHSFGRSSMGTGFHLWHGTTRYRFVSYHPVLPAEYGSSLVANAAESVVQMRQGLAKTALSRADVDRWHAALTPVIAQTPPAGVEVRPPLSSGRYLAAILGLATAATIVLIAIITAVVLMTA
jgi:hypothetical protein